MKAVNTIRKNVKKALDSLNIGYKVSGCMITTEYFVYDKLSRIEQKLGKYVPSESISYHIVETHGFGRKYSLEIDTGTSREEILKHLEGIGYRESYGYFTTEFNEVFITGILNVEPEVSLCSLLYDENHLVDEINRHLSQISKYNLRLRNVSLLSEEYRHLMQSREAEITQLNNAQKSLLMVREEMQNKYGLKLPKGEDK